MLQRSLKTSSSMAHCAMDGKLQSENCQAVWNRLQFTFCSFIFCASSPIGSPSCCEAGPSYLPGTAPRSCSADGSIQLSQGQTWDDLSHRRLKSSCPYCRPLPDA